MADGDQTLRRYDLLERIAVGGMAEVFRAKAYGAHGFEKTLAIKRILPDLARDPEFEDRFIAEAKLAVGLTHANIVQIFDFGRFAGSLYIAMEYVDGPDVGRLLKAAIERGEAIPLGAAMHVAMELCKGLDLAHARRVVHSDISPSNILLSRAGEVKIADFGIARASTADAAGVDAGGARQERVMGKWHYMSPEQTRGGGLDARSDLFSAAIVMFELFTGARLFHGDDIGAIVQGVREMPIPAASARRPSLPPALDLVLGKALQRDPAARYQHASELLRALLEVSYANTLVATAMDVADVIARWFPVGDPPSGPPRLDAADLDDLIKAQLGAIPSPHTSPSRVTMRASTPALGKVTFVRGAVGPDGIPAWELTGANAAPVAAAATPSRRRWIVAAALAAVAGVVAVGTTRAMRGARADAELRIESIPPGAQVWLDDQPWSAASPTTLRVAAAAGGPPRRLRLRLPGYRVWEDPAVALKPGDRVIYRPQLEPLSTGMTVTTEPPGADVDLDGRVIGRTPVTGATVPADGATHKLRLRRRGYTDVTVDVALRDRQDVVVAQKLAPAQRWGTIDLHVDPWALIYLDGRQIGEAPIKGLQLPVGRHQLKLVNPVKHSHATVTVDVPAKHPYRVRLP